MFPGAKASEDWQRQRDLLHEREVVGFGVLDSHRG
jgi:hypothetical protein